MARDNGTGSRLAILPEGATAFFQRRALEAGGVVLVILGVLLVLALVSYGADDPSANNATSGSAQNLLGMAGAYASDLILQTVGCAGAVLSLAWVAWGWRLISHRGLPWFWLNLAALPLAIIAGAVAAAAIGPPQNWPLAGGLGGWIGDALFRSLMSVAQSLGLSFTPPAYLVILAPLALGILFVALGLSWREWAGLFTGLAGFVASTWRFVTALGKAGEYLDQRLGGGKPVAEPVKKPEPEEPAPAARREPTLKSPSGRVAKQSVKAKSGKRAAAERQPTLDLGPPGEYQLPPLSLLSEGRSGRKSAISEDALEQNARILESVLDDFGVRGDITQVRPGPVVTLYELEPAPGTKTSRVIGLADDIARSMSVVSVRVAVVPGRNAIGIELPNTETETVYLRELLSSDDFENTTADLTLALGKDIGGKTVVADLARMPHLLIAGTTGSGKSVGVNSMILSLVYRLAPSQCRLILIDPKMLELSVYNDIPHLLTPVVTEAGKAVVALKWVVREMENRYRAMSHLGVRNITGYNQRLSEAAKNGEDLKRTVQTGFDPESGEPIYEDQSLDLSELPYIVVVVDEMADLMLVAGKDIEAAVQRLAQMARAAGIHIIMATQRPSVNVVTGTIKANFPTRISFQVTSKIDSRTILGEQGAEQLLGAGDMLFMEGGGRVRRVHGPFVSDEEVEKVVKFLRKQGRPEYLGSVTEESEDQNDILGTGGGAGKSSGADELYDQAVALVCRERKASTSFVQRYLQIGYNRAARIIEQMEREGVISAASRTGKREVLARDIDGFE